jgi:hypothetical protein
VYENRELRRIFGPKREESAVGGTGLYNEELHNLHISLYTIRVIKSRRMRWAGHVPRKGEIDSYNISVGKLEGKKPFLRPRHRWEDKNGSYGNSMGECGLDASGSG